MAPRPKARFSDPSSHLSLSLQKFSYVTTPRMYGKLVWTHVSSHGNLLAVFDDTTTVDSQGSAICRKLLKVFQDDQKIVSPHVSELNEPREEISLDDVIRQALSDESKRLSQSLTDSNRIVLVLVKKPFVAVKFQLPDHQIRRVQMNFASEKDYQTAVDAFMGLGLPVREKEETQSQVSTAARPSRPSTAPSSSIPHRASEAAVQSAMQHLQPLHPTNWGPSAGEPAGGALSASCTDSTVLGAPVKESGRGHTSSGKLETAPSTEDPLRRTLFPEASTKDRPASAPGAPMTLDTLSQMLPPPRPLPFAPPKPPKPSRSPASTPIDHSEDKGKGKPKAQRRQSNAALATSKLQPAPALYASAGTQTDAPLIPAKKRSGLAEVINIDVPAFPAANAGPTGTQPASNFASGPSAEEWVAAVADYVRRAARADAPVAPIANGAAACSCHGSTQDARPMALLAQAAETRTGFAAYANAPAEERRKALDQAITELIFDPEFEVLCQDVEAAWKRIGLGW